MERQGDAKKGKYLSILDFVPRGRKTWLFCVGLSFVFACFFSLETEASSDFSDYETVRHPLIQTTTVIEEYESLVNLGFLDTGVDAQMTSGGSEQISGHSADEEEYRLSEYEALLQKLQKEDAYEKAKASVVKINMGDFYGSGVIWDVQDGYVIIASNAHLLETAETGVVDFGTGTRVLGNVVAVSELRDIGFIKVALTELYREEWMQLRFAGKNVENYKALQPGDTMFVIGSTNGVASDYYEGTIGNVSYYFPEFHSNMLYAHCTALAGMSGGGTFDEQGHFIGMITAGTDKKEVASLPLEVMLEESILLGIQ